MYTTPLVNRRVLLLNQNYEPLSVCSARRAFVLLFEGKAEMLETADGLKVRTVTKSYSLPSVVRLWRYRKVPYKQIMLTRRNIIMRDDNVCQYCGSRRGPMTVDHVIPKMMNGQATWTNLVCACTRCNNKKGNRTPEQAGMKLLRKPVRPSYITFIHRHYGVQDRWKPYLFLDPSSGRYATT